MQKLTHYQMRKKRQNLCIAKYCRHKRSPRSNYCYRCLSRQYKERQPISYFFNALRNNARRRGKEFSLTLSQFRAFCEQSGYIEKKGKSARSLSIDRINPGLGYSLENIQVMSLSENSRKQHVEVPF